MMQNKQKILTVAIPCYNSAAYMDKCIKSLLHAQNDLEILIIDDGSTKDNTAQIADEYEKNYPGVIRAIHQENGGHGAAVNAGIRNATGVYFKVIDSDDWADKFALLETVDRLKQLEEEEGGVDMFLVNFVYDKVGAKHKKVMHFRHAFPVGEVFDWSRMRHMKQTQYILMHNIIYRHQVLVDSGLELPAHTFYVDNIFAFQPYPYVKKLYYLDVNFYHYYIGREDQSVNEQIMIGRIDQQIKVNEIMVDILAAQNFRGKDRHVKKIMYTYLDKVTVVTNILMVISEDPELLEKRKELWRYIREKSFGIWWYLKHTPLGMAVRAPGRGGRKAVTKGYVLARKLIGFN